MQLNNVFGLTGMMLLLQILDSMEISFAMAVCLLILSDDLERNKTITGKRKLERQNPLLVLSDEQFKKEFPFKKTDIPRLLALFHWPSVMRTSTGVVFTSEICFLMVLFRFSFPTAMNKLEIMFGYHASSCSCIVTKGVDLLYPIFVGTRLLGFDLVLVLSHLDLYQSAITKKSKGAVTTGFGLIDGTVHNTYRPASKGIRLPGMHNVSNLQNNMLYALH
jgi:hypothetical protein